MSTLIDTTLDELPVAPGDGDGLRFVAVRADLLPREVVVARAADLMRRRVLFGLAGLAAVLVLVFGFSWWQTHSARNDLGALQSRSTALNAQEQRFGPLLNAQSQTARIHSQLAQLMTGDLSWRGMLSVLHAEAPAGTRLTQVTGAMAVAGSSTGTTAAVPASTTPTASTVPVQVGTLTLVGTAQDKSQVAAYADALSRVRGLSGATPTSVTAGTGSGTTGAHSGGVTFTMTVSIMGDALGGRYASSTAASGTTTSTGGN